MADIPDNSKAEAMMATCQLGMVPVMTMACPHCGRMQHSNDQRLIRQYTTGQRIGTECPACHGSVYLQRPRIVAPVTR